MESTDLLVSSASSQIQVVEGIVRLARSGTNARRPSE
jgi:hypothetical protein